MKKTKPWVAPLGKIPASLTPIVKMQRKHYGAVLNPVRWWGRMPRLFWLVALFVGWLDRKKARLSPELRAMLMTRVSQQCQCAFCIDANTLRLAQRCNVLEKVQAVAHWPCSTLFSDAERAALEYADAMTATPPLISPQQKEALKRYYDDEAICEMTALVAFQNLSARFNAALEIPSQGLCDIQGKPHA